MTAKTPANRTIITSPEYRGSMSWDPDFEVSVVEGLVYNPVTGTMDRAVQPGQQLPTAGLNASYVLSYNASTELVRVVKTISGTSYTKNVTPLSGDTTITQTKTFSVWT
jgi:hypothetical protein